MSHSVARHLRVMADEYDAAIRRFIPGYETLLERAAQEVAAVRPRLVLDLGAGTGALSAALLAREATTSVELWDVDSAMLDTARQRLSVFAGRTRFALRSFFDPLPPHSAAMASLALHHVRELAQKTELYARICSALPAGGVLVNADATIPAEPAPAEAAFRAWADHMVEHGIERARAFEHFAEWASEDRYFSLTEELRALERAGFHARCAWQHGPMTLLVATRPGTPSGSAG